MITLNDCKELYNRFLKYTETAEQHEFVKLALIHHNFELTLSRWSDPINQREARAMFRVVLGAIGGDITPYKEKNCLFCVNSLSADAPDGSQVLCCFNVAGKEGAECYIYEDEAETCENYKEN